MSNKPTLFLLPGLLCDESVWAAQLRMLARYAEVKIPVFRGFNSLEKMTNHVLSMAPDRFSVAGHSMGGRVAWELMKRVGNRIDKFAVLSTGVKASSHSRERETLINIAVSEGLQAVAEKWIPPMIHHSRLDDSELIASIKAMMMRNTMEDFVAQMHALENRQDRTSLLSTIKQDVLLVTGETDRHCPPNEHQDMQKELQRSHLAIVPGAGHMVSMEKPDEVSTILLKWYTDHEDANN